MKIETLDGLDELIESIKDKIKFKKKSVTPKI